MIRRPPSSTLFPYPPLFRSTVAPDRVTSNVGAGSRSVWSRSTSPAPAGATDSGSPTSALGPGVGDARSEEHTSELQSQSNLVCRLLLEKKKTTNITHSTTRL